MLNDLFRTYKKIIILVVILLSAVVFWFYGCHRQKNSDKTAQTWEKTELSESGGFGYHFQTALFSGDVIFGTQGYLAEDKDMPVVMSMTSKESTFTGTLRITLPGEDGKGVSYQSAVNCKKGVRSKVSMEVPGLGSVSYFYFEILDSFGSLKFSQSVMVDSQAKEEGETESYDREVYLGVLSSQYRMLNYMDGMDLKIDEEIVRLRLIRFTAGNFPTDVKELSALSGVLLDAFDTSVLSQIQRQCLLSFVEAEGGQLFIGTGSSAKVVLKNLEEVVGVRAGKITEIQYDFNDELTHAGSVRLYSSLLHFTEPEHWKTYSFSTPVGIHIKEYGKGNISVLPFSLADDTFLQWTGRDRVVQRLLCSGLAEEIRTVQKMDTSLWYIKKSLYAFMNGRHPNTLYYALFFMVYLSVLGFFAYYFLRKIKKREYIWVMVPAISLFFTVCLAFPAEGNSGEKGKSFAALQIIDSAEKQDDYYLLYQNNEGDEGNVDLISSIKKVEPLDYHYKDDWIESSTIQNIRQDYTINNTQNGFDLAFEETVPGTSYLLKCSAKTGQRTQTHCFSVNIIPDYSSFEGTVSNTSSLNFEKVVLVRGRQYQIIDKMAAGETVQIDKNEIGFWTGYQGENEIFGDGDETTAIGNIEEYIQQRYILDNQSQDSLLVIGITDENEFALFSDEHQIKERLSVFVNRFTIGAPEEAEYIIDINENCLDEENQEESLKYDILEKNETKAIYTFDTTKVVWGMFRNRDNFEGTIYAYNYDTQDYDVVFGQEDQYMNCGELEPYISEMNKMILRICLPDDTEYGSAPVLSLLTRNVQ